MKVCGQTGNRTQNLLLTSQVPYRLRYAALRSIAGDTFNGISLCCPFSHEMFDENWDLTVVSEGFPIYFYIPKGFTNIKFHNCTARQCCLIRQNLSWLYNQSSSIVLDEPSSYWSIRKSAKFSALHWSTSRSQAFIGQLLGTSRVVHLPKRIARPVNVA